MVDLKAIFKEKIFIETKVKSIDSLFLNEDRLENTNYNPTYQRNYVWDEEKATYFIESIFLGTEIPPLIFFQKDLSFEVIDGRQRYETILRFVRGELRLRKSGLHKLGSLKEFVGKNFKELSEEYGDMFLRTKIRTIVFSFRSEQFSQEEEDAVKREIFQRYNSGITPLKSVEIDKAIYLKDDLNTFFKKNLKEKGVLLLAIRDIFAFEKDSIEVIMKKIREMLVLPHIPIYYYANRKLDIVHRFFEFLSQEVDDEDSYEIIFSQFQRKIMLIKQIKEKCLLSQTAFTRLLAECFYWALSIIALEKGEKVLDEIDDESFLSRLVSYIGDNIEAYKNVRSSFSGEFKKRYDVTAKFFSMEFNLSFKNYLSTTDDFKEKNKEADSITDVDNNSFGFENLRINKPEPVSEEIEDICRKLAKNNFLMRPTYQRDEVINKRKSSAIIESLLLGIRLPPIFVFNRNDGVQEVIDGQQRLLSILGFIGQKFKDENGNLCSSKKEGFRLDLKNGILTDLNGATFEKLDLKNQQKIKRAELWIIEIDKKYNPDFEPIDLFIRLNNKPYPIRKDTFEMWNSYICRDIIDSVKNVFRMHNSWFYLRKKETRMENENLLMTLAYFIYQKHQCPDSFTKSKLCPDKTVGIYMVGGKINCRLKSKTDITKILEEKNNKQEIIRAINILNFDFIANLEILCRSKEHLSKMLDNLFGSTSSKRTQQNFYILWLLLADLSFDSKEISVIRLDINKIVKLVDTAKTVDEFTDAILEFRQKYQYKKANLLEIQLGDICTMSFQTSKEEKTEAAKQSFDIVIDREVDVNKIGYILCGNNVDASGINRCYGFCHINVGFNKKYVASLLYVCARQHSHLTLEILKSYPVVYVSISCQNVFAKVFDYIQACKDGMDSERQFFLRLLEIMAKQLKAEATQTSMVIDMVSQVELLPELDDEKNNIANIYQKCSNVDSPIMLLLLRALNI